MDYLLSTDARIVIPERIRQFLTIDEFTSGVVVAARRNLATPA